MIVSFFLFICPRKTCWGVLCTLRSVHPDTAHPYRGQLLRDVLQEQTLENRGQRQEAGAD